MTEKADCPCCKLPTLPTRGAYEICQICWWEDDGQDDPDADQPNNGPNGEYSLTQARNNFADHWHMYDTSAGIEVVENPSPARLALIDWLRGHEKSQTKIDQNTLESLLGNLNP